MSVGASCNICAESDVRRAAVLRFEPGHPDANPDGLVAYPNVEPVREMVDMLSATRSPRLRPANRRLWLHTSTPPSRRAGSRSKQARFMCGLFSQVGWRGYRNGLVAGTPFRNRPAWSHQFIKLGQRRQGVQAKQWLAAVSAVGSAAGPNEQYHENQTV